MICNNFPQSKFVAVSLFIINLHSLPCGLVNSVVIYRYTSMWEAIYLPREVPVIGASQFKGMRISVWNTNA